MKEIVEKLGYLPTDKLLIIHADDAGLCFAENEATKKALEKGIVNSTSIMMPCSWAYEMAVYAKENPQFDYGIHLTLTCEWKNYKFGPVLSAAEVPSLVDKNGHFYPKRAMVKQNVNPSEVKKELKAQIELAIAWGVKPTHLDSHMFCLGLTKEIINVYRELGKEYNLAIFLSKQLLGDFNMETEKYILDTDFPIEAVLPDQTLSLREILNWKVGSQFHINSSPKAPVALKCGSYDLGLGKVGQKSGNVAISVEKLYKREGE